MSHTTSIRRSASIVGAAGLIALCMAGPASARPDPGTGGSGELRCSTSCYEGGSAGNPDVGGVLRIDGNGVQVLQLGAGIVAGVALAGAGMAVASRRS
ncbi:MAG: hypothetical protein WB473_15110, partial [Pedococcus sp.]